MKMHSVLLAMVCATSACGEHAGNRSDEGSSSDSGSSDDGATTTTPTTTMPSTTSPGTTDPTTASTTDPTDATETGTDTGDEPYDFDDAQPEEYTQVDRLGMPAVATMLVTSKDDYDHATPADDAMAQFVPEITASIGAFHDALDDDVAALGLTPCAVDACSGQVTSLVVPDVLRIDLAEQPGFPNGRTLADPVMDMMLALILLDLEAHDLGTLADLPLNPGENDEPLDDAFPYLAEPH